MLHLSNIPIPVLLAYNTACIDRKDTVIIDLDEDTARRLNEHKILAMPGEPGIIFVSVEHWTE